MDSRLVRLQLVVLGQNGKDDALPFQIPQGRLCPDVLAIIPLPHATALDA